MMLGLVGSGGFCAIDGAGQAASVVSIAIEAKRIMTVPFFRLLERDEASREGVAWNARDRLLLEHDLFPKTGVHFSGSCSTSRRAPRASRWPGPASSRHDRCKA